MKYKLKIVAVGHTHFLLGKAMVGGFHFQPLPKYLGMGEEFTPTHAQIGSCSPKMSLNLSKPHMRFRELAIQPLTFSQLAWNKGVPIQDAKAGRVLLVVGQALPMFLLLTILKNVDVQKNTPMFFALKVPSKEIIDMQSPPCLDPFSRETQGFR